MENGNPQIDWTHENFLLANPGQIPKTGDILFHVSPTKIERFETKIPGSMFFTKTKDLPGLTSNKNRFLYTIRVKKDFSLSMLAQYHRDRKHIGWGVRLNEKQTEVKWLDISDQLLNDLLEITAVEELPFEQLVQEPPTPAEIRQRQKLSNFYLQKLMDQQLSETDLLPDKSQIFKAVGYLEGGDINSVYDVAQINQRLVRLGWAAH